MIENHNYLKEGHRIATVRIFGLLFLRIESPKIDKGSGSLHGNLIDN